MKKLTVILLLLAMFACNKEEPVGNAPELPPAETMVIDFSRFGNTAKSGDVQRTSWLYSAVTVGVWNSILGTTFAVPVAAFKMAMNHQPKNTGDRTWQWEYKVNGFTSQYTARLTGTLEATQVNWKMYISKDGIDSFDEFLWFEGSSQIDGKSGQWILYHSTQFPVKTVQIDWKKEAEEVGEIKYSYIRESDNQGQPDAFHGSSLSYGLQEAVFDAYITVHAFDNTLQSFTETFIEWNTTDFTGRVKAEHFFNDTDWHCWDIQGYDTDCE